MRLEVLLTSLFCSQILSFFFGSKLDHSACRGTDLPSFFLVLKLPLCDTCIILSFFNSVEGYGFCRPRLNFFADSTRRHQLH